jgi:hypothetical protein
MFINRFNFQSFSSIFFKDKPSFVLPRFQGARNEIWLFSDYGLEAIEYMAMFSDLQLVFKFTFLPIQFLKIFCPFLLHPNNLGLTVSTQRKTTLKYYLEKRIYYRTPFPHCIRSAAEDRGILLHKAISFFFSVLRVGFEPRTLQNKEMKTCIKSVFLWTFHLIII